MSHKRPAPQTNSSDQNHEKSEILHNVVAMVSDLKQELSGLKQELKHQREAAEVTTYKQHEEIWSLRESVVNAIEEAYESNFISQIPEFHGLMDNDMVLDWLETAKQLMDCASVSADRRVKLAVIRFRRGATNWWWMRQERGTESPISTWEELEREMKSYFLPWYKDKMFWDRLELKQGSLTVHEYTNLFHEHLWKAQCEESTYQTMERYLDGLEYNIRQIICSHTFKSLHELVNVAKGVEDTLINNPHRNGSNQF